MFLKDLEDILNKCRRNDKTAQASLYKWLAPKLLGICLRYMQNRDEAEDVMQDSFVKIFMKLGSYKAEGSFEGWAKRITVNEALTALKLKNRIHFERDLAIVESIDEEAAEYEFDGAELFTCLQLLPDGYRTIINMFLIEEYTHKEIGEKLSISESTSRSQFSRAKTALLKLMNEKKMSRGNKYA